MDADSFPRINRVILTGYIQQDPELRFTPGGIPVASFRMRIARLLPENRGAKETVSYITVVAWQDLAQKVSRDGKNGQGVAVEGFLHSRTSAPLGTSGAPPSRCTRLLQRRLCSCRPRSMPGRPGCRKADRENCERRAEDRGVPGEAARATEERGGWSAEEPSLPFTSESDALERTDRSDSPTDGEWDESQPLGQREAGFPH
ncbi:MAG: single-stranded DNA-binding protein [Candidatus Eisenbacteria bacterium]